MEKKIRVGILPYWRVGLRSKKKYPIEGIEYIDIDTMNKQGTKIVHRRQDGAMKLIKKAIKDFV